MDFSCLVSFDLLSLNSQLFQKIKMSTQPQQKLFSCTRCCYIATTSFNLKRHLTDTHGLKVEEVNQILKPKLNIQCHKCPYTVSSKKQLIEHLNLVHFCGIKIEENVFDSEEGKQKLIHI